MPVSEPPRLYLLLENPKKSNNLGPILRCAAAFGVSQVVAVGYDKCSTQGSHGAAKHVSMIAFPTVDQTVSYLRNEQECKSLVGILGGVPNAYDASGYNVVERHETDFVSVKTNEPASSTSKRSYPIHTRPFVEGNCCFVICKSPNGLPKSLANQCDFFVHVAHVQVNNDIETSRLLDVPSCLSITLHHFTAWAKWDDRSFQGHKYEVGTTKQPSEKEREAVRLARAKAREEAADSTVGADAVVAFFGKQANSADY